MTGEDVDPRFTLANERTFLAWIRTSLGLLAAAAALVAVDLPWPDWAVRLLALLLAVTAGLAALLACRRWQRVEQAIETGQRAPGPRAHITLSLVSFSWRLPSRSSSWPELRPIPHRVHASAS